MADQNYFVVAPDGTQYGPADLELLQRWKLHGRVDESTLVSDGSTTFEAREVPGLFVPIRYEEPDSGPTVDLTPITPYPRPTLTSQVDNVDGRTLILGAYICSSLSLLFCPPGFGLAGYLLARRAHRQGVPGARLAMVVAVVSALIAIAWNIWTLDHNPAFWQSVEDLQHLPK